jgi:ribosome-binding factor A
MSRRTDRLSAQLKRELSAMIRARVRDPRVGLVTVTHVRVTKDLSHARVFVRLPGSDEERSAALDGLRAAAPFLRREIGVEMKVRRVPELDFQEDESLDHAIRIEELLTEVRPEGGWVEEEEEEVDTSGDEDGEGER